MRTHQGPLEILLNPLHEEIGRPQGIEQVTCSDFFLTVILSKVQPIEYIGVPWLEIDCECSWPLVATLVDIPSSVVEDAKHRNKAIGGTISASNIRTGGTDIVAIEADATGCL